ncbi:MAG: PLP-dependent aminotransferase family protein [Candidatus Obscuribacterales bacterium]|nr:PLP-dependent aminotransferase family protein [Candidatus Obscuribacterales bacterium]
MDFVLTLTQDSRQPVYKQVSEALKLAILGGRLKPGEKLPSTRDLADSMNVSRFTVIRSYEELSAQGYIQTTSGSGTFVNKEIPGHLDDLKNKEQQREPVEAVLSSAALSVYGERVMTCEEIEDAHVELFAELNYGAPTVDQLPLTRWKEMLYRATRFQDGNMLAYHSDAFGYMPLREAICNYLIRSRSVNCTPDRVAIFSGAQGALDLMGRLLIDNGDAVALENPGFPGARRSMLTHGAEIIPIPVDGQGMIVEHLQSLNHRLKLAYVTPSHHDPTGVVLSLPRRIALLDWAARTDSFIIEDDYDSEYRYGDKPMPSLQGLDENDCTIYLSTFWKVLYPVVRIGFVVLPRRLVRVVGRAKALIERDFPLLEQKALADFIDEGHLERHIKRTRVFYAKRRAALVQAVTKQFGKRIYISPVTAGMHLLVRFGEGFEEEKVLAAARNAEVSLVSTSHHYVVNSRPGEYLMGFAHLPEENIHDTVQKFASNLGI